MRTLMTLIRTRGRAGTRERGAALTEYGLLLALIAAVVITILTTLGEKIRTVFETIANALPGAG
jgi:pilus assembly protein Flp/PilA